MEYPVTERRPLAFFRTHPLGDNALMIDLGGNNDRVIQDAIAAICHSPLSNCIVDTVPTYEGVTLFFDPLVEVLPNWSDLIQARLTSEQRKPASRHRLRTLPVCYDPKLASDIHYVSEYTGLSQDEVIERHCAPTYLVRFLGFSPGFAFLDGLDPILSVPRKATPRLKINAGSVGLGGAQTGIYPNATPGGWQIIGQTPHPLLNFEQDSPTFLEPGEQLKFEPIELEEFENWKPQGVSW